MAETALTVIDKAGAELDRLSEGAKALSVFDGGRFSTALAAARMMVDISAALDAAGVREAIMPLIGRPIGIRTDRDGPGKDGRPQVPYAWAEVKPCVIEAIMRGLPCVGNCWNIIARRCYVTKEGFGLLLRNMKGLRYSIICGVPENHGDKGCVVDTRIRWTIGGQDHDETVSFAVRLNAGMGADAAIGKATRKARAWLYGTITGSEIPEGEAEDVLDVTAKGSDKPTPASTATVDALKARKAAAVPAPAADPKPEAKAAAVPYKPEAALAAMKAVDLPEDLATAYLRATGALGKGETIAQARQQILANIVERPADLKAAASAWLDQQAK